MAIKAVFPTGTGTISVSGLFQWDYGQILEIESAEIGSEIVEVHFACPSMAEAVVRPCTFSNGVGTVTIPDQCLEQTNTITAWIFEIEGTQGRTIKTITLPITARKRPGKTHDIPPEYIDKYAELITEINEAVRAIGSGNIKVASATNADNATRADTAGNAQSATHATTAGSASSAATITPSLIASCAVLKGSGTKPSELSSSVLYIVTFRHDESGIYECGVCLLGTGAEGTAIIGNAKMTVSSGSVTLSANSGSSTFNGTLRFYKLATIV